METANTYLYYDTLPTTSGAFVARAKTAAAGAIIKSVASLLLILFIGMRNEAVALYEKPQKGSAKTAAEVAGAASPAGPPPRSALPASSTVVSPV